MARRAGAFWAAVAILAGLGAIGMIRHQDHTRMVNGQLKEARAGQVLFNAMCETCHGPDGNGAGGAPVLNDGRVVSVYTTTASLAHFIQTHMPASDPGILTTQQATDLALWIRQFKSGS